MRQQHASIQSVDSACESLYEIGNTILHLAATTSKPKTLDWILKSDLGAKLTNARNYAGYTPLEALQSMLEANRVRKELRGGNRNWPASDDFQGFSTESSVCLMKLRGVERITRSEFSRRMHVRGVYWRGAKSPDGIRAPLPG